MNRDLIDREKDKTGKSKMVLKAYYLKMVYKNGQELLSPNNALAFMSGENKSCMRRASVVQVHLQRSSI